MGRQVGKWASSGRKKVRKGGKGRVNDRRTREREERAINKGKGRQGK